MKSELQELYEEVVNVIDCLYRTSMLVRKPARHNLLLGCRKSDAAEFEIWDKKHVRDKFSTADEFLIERLGWATTQRRKHLIYWKRHNAKLGRGIEDLQGTERSTTESVLSDTVATEFNASDVAIEGKSSNSGLSETSYASSLFSGGTITLPPPPRESQTGKPFECPYCYMVIVIHDTRSWTQHIFADIRPYVCTFKECETGNTLYDRRHDWVSHSRKHNSQSRACCLCGESLVTPKQLERHIGWHLEEVALFVLPRTSDGSDYDNKADVDFGKPIDRLGTGLSDSDSFNGYEGQSIDSNSVPDESNYDKITGNTNDQQGSSITSNQTSPSLYTEFKNESQGSLADTEESTPNYRCLHPDCSYKARRQHDLGRHMKTHFPPRAEDLYDCPGKNCTRVGIHGFTRKDHMSEHLVNYHLWDPKTKKSRPREGGEKRERR